MGHAPEPMSVRYFVAIPFVVMTAPVVAFLVYRLVRKAGAANRQKIVVPPGIIETGFVRIGGIDQWVSIRGENRSNPALLIVHGGPGTSFLAVGYEQLRAWEKSFTLIQWEQRGAGRTFARNGEKHTGEVSIDRLVEDGLEVTAWALARIGQRKTILLGHSMGSIIGLEMARRRPSLFHAYVGTGQIIDRDRNEEVGYSELLERVRKAGDQKAESALIRIGRPPYKSQGDLFAVRKVLRSHPAANEIGFGRRIFSAVVFAPDMTLKDIYYWASAQQFSFRAVLPGMLGYRSAEDSRTFSVPMVFIQGSEDIQTPTALVEQYYEAIYAPKKEFVRLSGGGHAALLAMPEAFLCELKVHVRRFATDPESIQPDYCR
jgi:proline iminopeptidase